MWSVLTVLLTFNQQNLPVILDWVGSLLMLGTVWGWFYRKIAPPIKRHLSKAERHHRALRKLMRARHGKRFEEDPFEFGEDSVSLRVQSYRRKLDIDSATPFVERVLLQSFYAALLTTERSTNPQLEPAYQEMLQYKADRWILLRLILRYGTNYIWFKLMMTTLKMIDSFTTSIFSGRLGWAMFVIGFLIWNMSKLLSLYAL